MLSDTDRLSEVLLCHTCVQEIWIWAGNDAQEIFRQKVHGESIAWGKKRVEKEVYADAYFIYNKQTNNKKKRWGENKPATNVSKVGKKKDFYT